MEVGYYNCISIILYKGKTPSMGVKNFEPKIYLQYIKTSLHTKNELSKPILRGRFRPPIICSRIVGTWNTLIITYGLRLPISIIQHSFNLNQAKRNLKKVKYDSIKDGIMLAVRILAVENGTGMLNVDFRFSIWSLIILTVLRLILLDNFQFLQV